MLIPSLILVPIVSAALILLPIKAFDDRRTIWSYALLSTLVTFMLSLVLALQFNWGTAAPDGSFAFAGGMQMTGSVNWIEGFGLRIGYGIDSISLWLILLTTFLMPIVMCGSLTAVENRVREYYFWLLLLQAAMIGTFVATDIVFFYVCFEFTLVPLYFLIGVFGSKNRLKAARIFFLYTFTGSMLTLAGVLFVAWFNASLDPTLFAGAGTWTFDIATLYQTAGHMTVAQQSLVLGAMLAGFAVKVPLFPVHTWLPLAHTEAPTAGSVILAGVLLKLGTYGMLRLAIPMSPDALPVFIPWIAMAAVIGVLYAALICWVQTDVKKLIAYSSVSHLGFCVLGLFAFDSEQIGAVGAVMYMLNHGLSTGALFLCIGMIYERFHTREMAQMSGLAKVMPVWATFMVFFTLASVGLPGLNGFVGEFLTLWGAFMSSHLGFVYAAIAGVGMIFAGIYLMYLLGRVVWGPLKVPDMHGHELKDLNPREIITLLPLAAACLVLGLYPYPMLKSLEGPVAEITRVVPGAPERAVVDAATPAGDDTATVRLALELDNTDDAKATQPGLAGN